MTKKKFTISVRLVVFRMKKSLFIRTHSAPSDTNVTLFGSVCISANKNSIKPFLK